MRYENQVLFDKGLTTLAYQLEAMQDKAPELADDFDNLQTVISDLVEDVETNESDAYDRGFDDGHSEGYSDAEFENMNNYDEGYEDGKSEGYEEGFNDGHSQGYQEAVDEQL